MSAARDEVLARIRAALSDVPPAEPADTEPPRDYRVAAGLQDAVATFAERVAEYRASVRRVDADLAGAIARVCERHGARRIAIPPDLPDAWRPQGVELVPDHGLAPRELDALDGVLSGCALAIAQTGTIVLDHGPGQGRRALTLVPDLHICVVRHEQVVGSLPEAIRALEHPMRPITLVSGPSATSDIELSRVEGVHGPRRLEVLLVPSPGARRRGS